MHKAFGRFAALAPRTNIIKNTQPLSFAKRNVTEEISDKYFRILAKALKKEGANMEDLSLQRFLEILKKNPEAYEAYQDIRELDDSLELEENNELLMLRDPVNVAVTGASGQIGYSLLFRIASGAMLGNDVPINLQLLELPGAMKALEGVVMELKDCAFPQLRNVTISSDPKKAFEGANYALLVGAKPRTKGMERADLLKENAKIFEEQGKALNEVAAEGIRVLVVGNPANTNAMITSHFAPKLSPSQIHAMTKLDHNRGVAQLAEKIGCLVTHIDRFVIWGNHSPTMYPDISHCLVAKDYWAKDLIKDDKWYKETFIPAVQQRGAAVINARGLSSAASAASAAIEHMREWSLGTGGKWTSFAVCSDGSYGVDKGLWYSFPTVVTKDGGASIVTNVPIDQFSAERMEITRKELADEKAAVANLLK